MIILDAPYASRPLVQWLGQSQHSVLANGFFCAPVAEEEAR